MSECLPPRVGREIAGPALGRRDLLLGLLFATSAAVLPRALGTTALERWLRCDGAALFADHGASSVLGALYLDSHPDERHLETLAPLLTGRGGGCIGRRLIESIADDWAAHAVVSVDGWIMARTEARLCAVLHLMMQGA